MTDVTASYFDVVATDTAPRPHRPKPDWPLMSDVASFRAGVPEALIAWRRARGEDAPLPSDPDCLNR